MQIKDLKPKTGNVDIVVEIVEKTEPRTFEKFGKPGRVCNATIKDETGKITLTLWNEDCDKVNAGDTVHIINGWVSEWQGELQLSTGKFGKLEVTAGKAKSKKEEPAEETASEESVEVEEIE